MVPFPLAGAPLIVPSISMLVLVWCVYSHVALLTVHSAFGGWFSTIAVGAVAAAVQSASAMAVTMTLSGNFYSLMWGPYKLRRIHDRSNSAAG